MPTVLIMTILLAVVALVVVNALKGSPWGTFTIAATMPIAVFMGLYLRFWRPAKVLECSFHPLESLLVVGQYRGGAQSPLIPALAAGSPYGRHGAGVAA